jgi:hypothetical protein
MRLRPPNRRNRSASSSFLSCAIRVGCDTYSTVAVCAKIFSFATAMKELNHIASVPAPRALGICALDRLAQVGWLCTIDARIFRSAKAADRYYDIRKTEGGCVPVETTPTLRWPAKSEAMSPALLPPERKPVNGEPFDSDPRQRDQDRR